MAKLRHVVALPLPAQGHVTPLLKLSHWLAEHGVKVTFVNTETVQEKLRAARPELFEEQTMLRFVALPDAIESDEDQKDPAEWVEWLAAAMSPALQELIAKINGPGGGDDERINCLICDVTAGWGLEVAQRMGIEGVGFWPAGAACFSLQLHIPMLIEDGVIDEDGTPLPNVTIKISEKIPTWRGNIFTWSCRSDPTRQRALFGFTKYVMQYVKHLNFFLCNTFEGLEPLACKTISGLVPVGLLMAGNISMGHLTGSFLTEDFTCLDWLNEQSDRSVVYVALGSTTILSQHQFEELAAGLEETGRPFLWVVRPDLVDGSAAELPDEFLKRVINKGKIVPWAPQERVLAHKSTACFLSHCGWNSTTEGISNGVPFICLPYFADQYQNSAYICDVWKVGVSLVADKEGVITRQEIKNKIMEVLCSDEINENSLKYKDMARDCVSKGGSSFKNLQNFIENRSV